MMKFNSGIPQLLRWMWKQLSVCEEKPIAKPLTAPEELISTDRVYTGQRILRYNTYENGKKVKKEKNFYLEPTEFSTQTSKVAMALDMAGLEVTDDDFIKMIKILYFVQEHITYITDSEAYGYPEHFQFSYETFTLGQGDCEDSTLLAYDMARYAGIPLNKVFVVYGSISKGDKSFGHAFLAYKDAVGTWFVGETTLKVPTPMGIWHSQKEYIGDKGLVSWDKFKFKDGEEPWKKE